jgi:hypothetical protein
MAVSIDKETLIKHRFWIALGTFALFWLVVLILVPTVQGSRNRDLKTDYDGDKKKVEGINDVKTDAVRKPLEVKEGRIKEQKNIVWAEAWKNQSGMMTWPEDDRARLNEKLSNAVFGRYISTDDRGVYAGSNGTNGLYHQYVTSLHLPEMVAPVQFKGGWKNVIKPVTKWSIDPPPTTEECWLAQEDLWVRRELLDIVRTTLDSIRIFKPYDEKHGEKAPPPSTEDIAKAEKAGAKRFVMHNSNWMLELVLEPDPRTKDYFISALTRIKNINPWRRTLVLGDVQFRITQGDSGNFLDFAIPEDRLDWDQSTDIKKAVSFGNLILDVDKEFRVEQMLTWSTSPIKRIDALALGYNSHRTANRVCKAKPIGNVKPPADKDPDEAATMDPSNPMGMYAGAQSGYGSSAMGKPILGAGGTGGPNQPGGADKGFNAELERKRYLDFTPQVRWMPVGVSIIVDQEYTQDFQVAMVNSRLRIQPTQVAWRRVHGIRPDASATDKKDKDSSDEKGSGGEEARPPSIGPTTISPRQMYPAGSSAYRPTAPPGGFPTLPPKGAGSALMPGKGGMPFYPGGYAGNPTGILPGVGSAAPVDEDDPNLVELTVYGIASLYERYTPKPDAPKTETPKSAAPKGDEPKQNTPAKPDAPKPDESKGDASKSDGSK